MVGITRIIRRRRGAGMTEYIILVGLIAVLLVGVIKRYKTQLEVTVVGTDGNGGMTGELGKEVTNPIATGGGANNGGGSNGKPANGTEPSVVVNETTGRTEVNGTTYTATRSKNPDGTFGPWTWQ